MISYLEHFFQNMESLRIQSPDLPPQNLFHTGMEGREEKPSRQNKFLEEVGLFFVNIIRVELIYQAMQDYT